MTIEKHYNQGKQHLKDRNLDSALVCFNAALEISPNQAHILCDRGVVYFHMKKFELSIIDMDNALQSEPNNPYRYSSRAYIRAAIGDVRGGIEDYKKAIQLDPNDAVAHNNLGLLEEKLGYESKAKFHFNKADELAEKDEFYANLYGKQTDKNVVETNQSKSDIIEENIGYWDLVFQVFKSKKTFKEFLIFLKNGFKLK